MTAEVAAVKDNQLAEEPQNTNSNADAGEDVVVVVERDAVIEKPANEETEEKTENRGEASAAPDVTKSASFKEESSLGSDLKEYERKALSELRQKVEEVILNNKIFDNEVDKKKVEETGKPPVKEEEQKEVDKAAEESKEEKIGNEGSEEKAVEVKTDEAAPPPKEENYAEGAKPIEENPDPELAVPIVVDENISLWGVPLLPSKGAEGIDVVLLKFLRAREFKVNDAFEMLRNTLRWRKENKIDSILEEELGGDLSQVAYMDGMDREGHPVCYNIYGVFENEELYQKTFGTEEKRQEFLRWRFQLMEKGIKNLDFKPGGVSSLLQITDLKNSPGPSKKELRVATKQAVGLLQDNYPEFVARNIFINVPFWYYAFNALLSPFLTQRTKSKFLFARPAKVTETLLKYIPAEQVPVNYGGLKRENDSDFSIEDGPVSDFFIKGGSKETIEVPQPEVGTTLVWDLTVSGWEVNYKEEFVPTDEGSYTIIVQKEKKMNANDEPVRNSFKNNEPGKIVITIDNSAFKKKRVMYRHKIKSSSS
ncbi:hypothetical protein Syun_009558 [Stephania yunnanensis]|uniref:Patellin-4 n=1 Tax=Stephania yunnanensis TaxID=152371 RepID=A0AAP0KGM2_9MAGN